MTPSYLSYNSCCNSLLAWITKQFNGSDVWLLVATSLATEKILVATQLHESQCKSNGLKFYWALSYFSVYWEMRNSKTEKKIMILGRERHTFRFLAHPLYPSRFIYQAASRMPRAFVPARPWSPRKLRIHVRLWGLCRCACRRAVKFVAAHVTAYVRCSDVTMKQLARPLQPAS
jgi:hypothetical protein